MFRRTTGFVFGYVFGLASSWYVVRRLRLRLQRYRPPQVATRLTDGIDAARRTVGVAVSEGRAAMREREADKRLNADIWKFQQELKQLQTFHHLIDSNIQQ